MTQDSARVRVCRSEAGCATRTLNGQAQATQAHAAEFQQEVLPVLSKSCLRCHNDRLEGRHAEPRAFKDPVDGAGSARPSGRRCSKGQCWSDAAADRAAAEPGRSRRDHRIGSGSCRAWPTAVERATQRRARHGAPPESRGIQQHHPRPAGVAARPADEFPVDDSGYGFDNNSDVLSVSPMLMEKYMQAAEKISRLAVYGETVPAKPTRLVRLMNRRSQDAYDVLSEGNSGVVSAVFPARRDVRQLHVPGRWRVRVPAAHREFPRRRRRPHRRRDAPAAPKSDGSCSRRAGSSARRRPLARRRRRAPARRRTRRWQPRREPTPEELKARDEAARKAAPPRKLILTVDGAPVISTVIEGTGAFGYSQGEFTARATVKAGERFIRASYPELANLDNPLREHQSRHAPRPLRRLPRHRRAVQSEHGAAGELQEDLHLRRRRLRSARGRS